MQAAKFDRAAGARVAASLGCARTAESDEEWAQFLDVATSLLVKKKKTSEDQKIVDRVFRSIDADQLFDFLKSEVAQGKSESQLLFRDWLSINFPYENPPPLPWEQINELTDVISQNSSKPGVLEFLRPILRKLNRVDGPEAKRYLTNLRKSPAGKRIKELALTGSLQEKFDVFHLAVQIFDDKEVRVSYKNDLLDPNLNDSSVMVNSISQPWPALKPVLIGFLLRAFDTKKWESFDDNDAEAAYVSEAADLLIKVNDGFVKKELFSEAVGEKALSSPGFLEVLNWVFFDLVQRTSDKNLTQRLLKSFEALRASLAPEIIENDDDMKNYVRDLDYVIAFCKDFPPARLPPNSRLQVRKPREKAASKVEKETPVAESPKTATTANKPTFAGKTFAQWLDAAKSNLARQKVRRPSGYQSDDADDAIAGAILGCLGTVESDEEWAQLLEVTISCKTQRDRNGIIERAVEKVRQAVSADQLFDFVESEVVQGKTTSLRLLSDWFRDRLKVKDSPPYPWKQINELTDLINQNADKPGGLEFLTRILLSIQSIDGPEARAYVTKLRNSLAGKRVREIALTGNLQRRFDVSTIALGIFDDEAIRKIYQRDLLDSKLNNKSVYSSLSSRPWSSLRADLLSKIFIAMDPEYWTWDSSNIDAAAEAKYVSEAADLLAKVSDEFVVKQSLFSKRTNGQAYVHDSLFSNVILRWFFDVAQRTSDESIKRRMLQKLKLVKESLEPSLLRNRNNRLVRQLDYVIAYYKGDPPGELPPRTSLRVREKKEKPASQVEQVDPDAEASDKKTATPKTTIKQ